MTFGKPHGYNSDSTLKLECNGKYWEIINSLGTSKWLQDPTPVFLGGSKISHDSGLKQPVQDFAGPSTGDMANLRNIGT